MKNKNYMKTLRYKPWYHDFFFFFFNYTLLERLCLYIQYCQSFIIVLSYKTSERKEKYYYNKIKIELK